MRLGRGRIALLAVVVLALAALATTATWLGTRAWERPPAPAARYRHDGPGMMDRHDFGDMRGGRGYRGGMTGGSVYALAGGGEQLGPARHGGDVAGEE